MKNLENIGHTVATPGGILAAIYKSYVSKARSRSESIPSVRLPLGIAAR